MLDVRPHCKQRSKPLPHPPGDKSGRQKRSKEDSNSWEHAWWTSVTRGEQREAEADEPADEAKHGERDGYRDVVKLQFAEKPAETVPDVGFYIHIKIDVDVQHAVAADPGHEGEEPESDRDDEEEREDDGGYTQ